MKDLHPIQIEILRRLLYSDGLNYARIKPDKDMENSQFVFHLDKLIKEGLINKEGSFYTLTDSGKEFSNRMDVAYKAFRPFPKTTTMLCGVREIEGEKEFLMYTRKKSPFYGRQGFPSQKVLFGDSIIEVAQKGFEEETGLQGTPELVGIRHYRIYSQEDNLEEDKIMYIFLFKNPIGELQGCEEGDYFWVKEDNINDTIKNPLPEFSESLELIRNFNDTILFSEDTFTTDTF
jgi:hypothetical protein